MTKPIIGITANVRPNPAHEDINWSYAPSGFVEGVQRAGGLAILLPVSDPSEAKTYISMIDKLILIGGQNVDPKFYNEENHASEDDFFLERDIFEMAENIHYHVANIQQYAGKKVTILGGGDSAVDWALAFEKIAPTTLVHRRDNFRALEHSVQALQESSVTIKTPFVPSQLLGNGKTLDKLEITKVKSDEAETIEVDHLFVNYGFKSSVGNLKNWGLDLNRHKIIVNSKQESSQAGIYAIGDCCYYEGKIDLIATGLGEAPTAVNNAINYIDPDQKVQPKHSTSL